MTTRRAFTLIELIVVMSACAVILTMSAQLIHQVMHVQSKARTFFDIERSALRLSKQFRQDIHQARTADIGKLSLGKCVFLRLHFTDDQIVEYQNLEGTVSRTLSHNGSIIAREEFPFQPGIQLSIQEESTPGCFLLSIVAKPETIEKETDKRPSISHQMPVSFQSVANLGRDIRFQQTTVGQGISTWHY